MGATRTEALRIAASEALKLRAGLHRAKSPADFEKLGARALRKIDSLFSEKLAQSRDKIDCRSGCAFCCHLKVDALPIDVFILVEFMKRRLTAAQITEVHTRAKENIAKITNLTADEQMNAVLPCPLLQHSRCLCYEARPTVCRKHHSPSVTSCEHAFDNPTEKGGPPEVYEITYTLAPVIVATGNVWHEAGFDAKPYDLASALDEALSNPACFRRWRDQKSAFSKNTVAKDWDEAHRATVPSPPREF